MSTHTKRWHDEDPSQRSVEPNRAFACGGAARAPGETAIRTAPTGRPARRAHTVAARPAPNTLFSECDHAVFCACCDSFRSTPAPHHYRHRQAGVAVRRGCRSVRPCAGGQGRGSKKWFPAMLGLEGPGTHGSLRTFGWRGSPYFQPGG
jgi:hypothetical protein